MPHINTPQYSRWLFWFQLVSAIVLPASIISFAVAEYLDVGTVFSGSIKWKKVADKLETSYADVDRQIEPD